jgi:hypothetical protein
MANMIGSPRGVRRAWKRFALDLSKAGAILRDAGFVACDEDPAEAAAWLEAGQVRRIEATFSGGWSASLRVDRRGAGVLVQCFSSSFRLQKSAASG